MRHVLFFITLSFAFPQAGFGQWSPDPANNLEVATLPTEQSYSTQYHYRMLPDGSGGVYVIWEDGEPIGNTYYRNVHAQHLDSTGTPLWGNGGMIVNDTNYIAFAPNIVSDGNGGIVATWALTDKPYLPPNGDDDSKIQQVKRIAPDGTVVWDTRFQQCEIGDQTLHNRHYDVAPDGQGGIYISGQDSATHIQRIQRVRNDGGIVFPPDGAFITESYITVGSRWKYMQPDSAGGVIYAWMQNGLNEFGSHTNIYVQRMDSLGNRLWGPSGLPVDTSRGLQFFPTLTPDGTGGAYICYLDSARVVAVNRIRPSGTLAWGEQGKALYNVPETEPPSYAYFPGYRLGQPYILPLPGGKVAVAHTYKSDNLLDLTGHPMAQIFDSTGTPLWNNGDPAAIMDDSLICGGIVSDGHGGLYMALYRYSRFLNTPSNLYLQRISSTGNFLWSERGKLISEGISRYRVQIGNYQGEFTDPGIMNDNRGNLLLVWRRHRWMVSDTTKIYASRVSADGDPFPVEFLAFTAERAGSAVDLRWQTASESGNYGFAVQRSLDRQRWADIGFIQGAGTTSMQQEYQYTDMLTGEPASAPVLFYRLKQTDFDGTVSYSTIAAVYNTSVPQTVTLFPVYPNPVQDIAHVAFTLPDAMPATIRLVSTLGQTVFERAGSYDAGYNTETLVLNTIPAGMYFLELATSQGKERRMCMMK